MPVSSGPAEPSAANGKPASIKVDASKAEAGKTEADVKASSSSHKDKAKAGDASSSKSGPPKREREPAAASGSRLRAGALEFVPDKAASKAGRDSPASGGGAVAEAPSRRSSERAGSRSREEAAKGGGRRASRDEAAADDGKGPNRRDARESRKRPAPGADGESGTAATVWAPSPTFGRRQLLHCKICFLADTFSVIADSHSPSTSPQPGVCCTADLNVIDHAVPNHDRHPNHSPPMHAITAFVLLRLAVMQRGSYGSAWWSRASQQRRGQGY